MERLIYRLCGINPAREQHWTTYAAAMFAFNLLGALVLFALVRLQQVLPLNPTGVAGVSPALGFNIAASFVTNTNWQAYSGEQALSVLSQTLGLTVQNFLSAATGIAILIALIRGLTRKNCKTIGNFYVDVVRCVLYVLLPLSLIMALFLVSQGVPQSFEPPATITSLEGPAQTLITGPVASQVAIKQLGSNGGGYYNANAAHPYENPTPLANLVQSWAILGLAAALTFTFGRMVGDTRQGWALFSVMLLLFLAGLGAASYFESRANPALVAAGVDQSVGNMEGKEVRFGVAASTLWATATTAASNGSVNAMHDSFTPLGGLVLMVNMKLGEVVFGGVGAGLYGMLVFVIVTVFIAGLMVGRTPEYLGKKIESREIKLAVLALLVVPVGVLGFGALSLVRGFDHPAGAARAVAAALRLRLGGGQQRLGLRRLRRLHPLSGGDARAGDPDRPLPDHRAAAGHRRFAGGQEAGAALGRHPAHPRAAVHLHGDGYHPGGRRPDLLPGAGAGAGGRASGDDPWQAVLNHDTLCGTTQILGAISMTPEKEAELFTMLDRLLDMGRSQGEQLKALQQGQQRLEIAQGRLEGELSIIVQWMSSMDQRFMALMSPYKPPRKPAA